MFNAEKLAASSPMLLDRVLDRNPSLVEIAAKLHSDGKLPVSSWIIDLDAIAHNARLLSKSARQFGLSTYLMTKQFNRNAFVTAVALENGINSTVSVDGHCARVLARSGLPLGHVGHLNQISRYDTAPILLRRPEVWTVFSVEAARYISSVAQTLGVEQALLLRVVGPDDQFFPGQEGGFLEEHLQEAIDAILQMPNVRIAGVTSFPCVEYSPDESGDYSARLTTNAATVRRATGLLRDHYGLEHLQVNLPGNTSSSTMALLADAGATHVEPGHGLLGTTLRHINQGGEPELPSVVHVTEISHFYDDKVYAFGAGLWGQMHGIYKPSPLDALIATGKGLERVRNIPLDQIIDYHVLLERHPASAIGDTVVMAFYTQMQMTRSYIAVVGGVSDGTPEVLGIFDQGANLIDSDFNAVTGAAFDKALGAIRERYGV